MPADQFVEAAEFLLARDPLIGSPVDEDNLVYFLPMALINGQQVSLYYAFDEATVWLLSIVRV